MIFIFRHDLENCWSLFWFDVVHEIRGAEMNNWQLFTFYSSCFGNINVLTAISLYLQHIWSLQLVWALCYDIILSNASLKRLSYFILFLSYASIYYFNVAFCSQVDCVCAVFYKWISAFLQTECTFSKLFTQLSFVTWHSN